MKFLTLLAVIAFAPTALVAQFSSGLTPYSNNVVVGTTTSQVSSRLNNSHVAYTNTEVSTQAAIIQMYLDAGFDPSYDYTNDSSAALLALSPTGFVKGIPNTNLALSFSSDAPYYQAIPSGTAKILLPPHYFTELQLNSVTPVGNGDGIGFGEVSAKTTDPSLTVTSEWYTDKTTLVTFSYKMPSAWNKSLPALTAGDSHMIFVDPVAETFVSSYKTTINSKTKGPNALYISNPTSIVGMGDRGGSIAGKFAELPAMVQPGELIDKVNPIRHAIGGSILKVWGGRVYPASARDGGMLTSDNTCTGTGYMDTGIIPYGGVIQLDPTLDLSVLKLSLPALRILQAMQTYGYYVMDFGCTDIDIYTAVNESEVEPYGGMYGNSHGVGIQNEVQDVVTKYNLYVVPPMVKTTPVVVVTDPPPTQTAPTNPCTVSSNTRR